MKAKLYKVVLSLAVSTVMVLAGAVSAQEDKFVQCGFGGPVKDPFGRCVLSIGGTNVPGCVEVAKVVAPPTPTKETITLGTDTFFDFDKSVLKPAGKEKLNELAQKLRRAGATVTAISVVGHTDNVGTEIYNQGLSERRAQSVVDYLVQKGVNPNIISARGESFRQPIASNATAAGRAQNRRVEVTVDALSPPPTGG